MCRQKALLGHSQSCRCLLEVLGYSSSLHTCTGDAKQGGVALVKTTSRKSGLCFIPRSMTLQHLLGPWESGAAPTREREEVSSVDFGKNFASVLCSEELVCGTAGSWALVTCSLQALAASGGSSGMALLGCAATVLQPALYCSLYYTVLYCTVPQSQCDCTAALTAKSHGNHLQHRV
jgi:hypothetical protein